MFVIRRECLLRSGSPQLSSVIQVAVIPFEIDVPRHVNLDDRAFPRFFPRMVIPDVVFEQPDVIFANGCCKQLAESRAARLVVIADFCRRPAFRLSAAEIGTPFKPNQTS